MDKKLMRLFLDCPDYLKRVIISEPQIEVVRFVKDCGFGSATARELADHLDISVQGASGRLNKLWSRGWLKREERAAETGGIEHRYSSVV